MFDILQGLAGGNESGVGFSGLGNRNDFRAINEGPRVMSQDGHLGHGSFKFGDHEGVVVCFKCESSEKKVAKGNVYVLTKDCHSHAVLRDVQLSGFEENKLEGDNLPGVTSEELIGLQPEFTGEGGLGLTNLRTITREGNTFEERLHP